ncbi:MAG: hypothetical protein IKE01_01580 [Clostridia bacterium]|nr:hypothetical protein [Clostridia bacterium]MBR2785885.1 hypothetical protein [Clostridia bacterium]
MKIVDLFRNILSKRNNQKALCSPEEKYEQMSSSIDGIELSKMLMDSITPILKDRRQQYGNQDVYNYPLQTKISVADTGELVKKFFSQVDADLYEKVCDIDNGISQYATIDRNYRGMQGFTSNPSQLPVTISIPIFGDLRQLYVAVHEMTHSFDVENGDNTTRKILGEIAPQCMERLLDDFLLNLSDDEMKKYGFDNEMLKQDVLARKMSTFYDRLRLTENLYNGTENKEKCLRYMLAQICSTHFCLHEKNNGKEKLKTFIKHVQDDDFDGACQCFGMQIDKSNKLQRNNYVRETVSAAEALINPPQRVGDVARGTPEKQQER